MPSSANSERDGVESPGTSLFESERISNAAWAFATRRVNRDESFRIGQGPMAPEAGDLVLAKVDILGHHRGLQLWTGRKKNLFPGDEIVVVYGNRYAPSQFESIVPKTLGPCQLVAGGGVASKALSWHSRLSRGPTEISPIGLVMRADSSRVNLRDCAVESFDSIDRLSESPPPTIAVVGTSMDAGKTESAAFMVRGFTRAGLRVGFAKVTGTGAGGDTWLLKDAGADPVFDFTDAGHISTYLVDTPEIERVLLTLVGHLSKAGVDVIVLEIADGVLQRETAALLESRVFKQVVVGVLFTSRDSMGAMAGVEWLRARDIEVVGLSGVMTAAPLQCSEAHAVTGLEAFSREDLSKVDVARKLLAMIEDRGVARVE